MTSTPSPCRRHRSALPTAPRPTRPGRSPRHLPRPEPLIGDGAVAKHLARPDIRVGGQHVAGDREEQGECHLGDGVGIAARGVEHRDARRGGAGDVDVVRVAAGGRDGPQRQVEYRAAHRITLHDKHIRVLRRRPARPAARRCRSAAASARSTGRRPRRPARRSLSKPGPRSGAVTRARSRVTIAHAGVR